MLEQEIRLPGSAIEEALGILEEHQVVPTADTDPGGEVADPSDERVLATALEAGAKVLITGDRDLPSVKVQVQDLRILDPRDFWEELR